MIKFDEYCDQFVVKRDQFDRENVVIELRGALQTQRPRTDVDIVISRDKITPAVISACLTLAGANVGVIKLEGVSKADVPPEAVVGLDVGFVEKDGNLILL